MSITHSSNVGSPGWWAFTANGQRKVQQAVGFATSIKDAYTAALAEIQEGIGPQNDALITSVHYVPETNNGTNTGSFWCVIHWTDTVQKVNERLGFQQQE